MDTKTTIVALLVVLGLGVFLPFGNSSQTVVERVTENLGAVNSPDFSLGGVRLYSQQSTAFTQATNTVICSLQSPAGTSTLLTGGVQLTTATSGVTSLSISKSTSVAQIGTLIASTSVASGAVKSMEAASSTFNAQALADRLFSPNTYLNVAQQGGGAMNQSGSCNAVWQVL